MAGLMAVNNSPVIRQRKADLELDLGVTKREREKKKVTFIIGTTYHKIRCSVVLPCVGAAMLQPCQDHLAMPFPAPVFLEL